MSSWRAAYDLLRARADSAVDLVRAVMQTAIPPLPFVTGSAHRFVTTGIGSSAAHAALLAHLLNELGLPARVAAPGSFIAPPRHSQRDVLVVFSQGLSPNARLALARPGAWAGILLVTGWNAGDADLPREKRAAIEAVEQAGGTCITLPGGPEFGTLLRIAGPLAGYAMAYRIAGAVARAADAATDALELDVDTVAARMGAARAQVVADALDGDVALVASGGYGELAANLTLKVQEGLFAPRPPLWDLLEFAHGPFQQIAGRATTLLMLRRHGAPGEDELVARLRAMLTPERHRLLMLAATLPGAQALFEHEAALNELVLHAIARRCIDQSYRPDHAGDQPLYAVAEPAAEHVAPPSWAPHGRALGRLTWPELENVLAAGRRTAVLPLGATEQHGPHLPFATDTMIAEALAERFCARVDDAVRLPALPFGCSTEHHAFPGTVSLEPRTLAALLCDAVRSLAAHGFETAFIFSAHGGNCAPLAEALPAIRAAAAPLQVIAFTDLDAVVAAWAGAAAAVGVAAPAAGHHAGELETSIVLGLDAGAVRRDRLAAGLLDVGADPQSIFYPDLRHHAPSGVVGDPRRARGGRAARYLEAWVALLMECYRREKKAKNTSGTHPA